MSRRSRSRRDKRAPIPDFDDPQPRMPGLFHFWSHDRLLQRDRQVRGSVAAQPHQRRAHRAWGTDNTAQRNDLCSYCNLSNGLLMRRFRSLMTRASFKFGLETACGQCAASAMGTLATSLQAQWYSPTVTTHRKTSCATFQESRAGE